jgi:DnaJ-class molecular chaperone
MTGDGTDLYAVLGLTSQATQGEIRRAYLALVRHNHPDTRTVPGVADTEATNTTVQQVIAAYTVLGDPARRAVYDRHSPLQNVRKPTASRPVRRSERRTRGTPPIQAGPVLWHPS